MRMGYLAGCRGYVDKNVPTACALIMALLILGFFFAFMYRDSYFIAHNPPWPDPTTGQTIAKTFDHGKAIRYLSAKELRASDALSIAAFVSFIAIFLVIILFRDKLYYRNEKT